MCIVRRDKTPLVLADVVHLAAHVVITSDNVDLVLIEEALVRDAQLVHAVQTLPALRVHVEKMHFTVSVGVLAAYQNYLSRRNC